MSYNGWENYETWAVSLWIGNEEGLYLEALALAERHGDDRDNAWPLAAALKEWIGDTAPDLGDSLWAELLGAAISEVNWYEIAEHYLADLPAEEAEEAEA